MYENNMLLNQLIENRRNNASLLGRNPGSEPKDLQLWNFSIIDSSKADRAEMVESVLKGMESGEVDPLKVHLQLKNTENIIDRLTNRKDHPETANRYQSYLQDAAAKHPKTFELHNGKFTTKEAGTRYDFATCGDPIWNDLNAQMEALKAKMKEREELLKKAPVGGMQLLCDGGEVVTVFPPVKTSTTTLQVSLK